MLDTARQAAPNKTVMTTETGYYTSGDPTDPNGVDPVVQAKYLLDDVMDQFKAGVAMDYLYELVDEGGDSTNPEDNFGLFTANWSAKPAAVAIRSHASDARPWRCFGQRRGRHAQLQPHRHARDRQQPAIRKVRAE